ncbi:MAG: shikimate kinase [Cyanobacteriota bacterium]|jgi:shikimate kinase
MQDPLQGVNLFLIGMMGSGKSTVGHILAERLRYRFFDSDILIERVADCSVSDIFAQQGEAAFRVLESQVLAQLAAQTRSVIATGGGIILQQHNWSYLHHGIVVWLDVAVEILVKRLQDDRTRPLLQHQDLHQRLNQLLGDRQALYAQADLRLVITEEQSPQAIADNLLQQLPTVLKPQCSAEQN